MKQFLQRIYRNYQKAGYPLLPLTRHMQKPLRWYYHRSPFLRHDNRRYFKPYVLELLHRALIRTLPKDFRIYKDQIRFRSYGSVMSLHGYYVGEIEYHLVKFLTSRIKEGFVMFDVGAHHGLFTLVCAYELARRGLSGTVYSFEPFPENFELLCYNVRDNQLEPYAKLFNVAVANTPGVGNLAVGKNENSDNVLVRDGSGDADAGHYEPVKVMTIDQFCSEVQRVDLIKIDVQGGEPAVLEGAKQLIERDRPILIVEAVAEWPSTKHIRTLLQEYNYELFGVTKNGELCPVESGHAFISWDWVGLPR